MEPIYWVMLFAVLCLLVALFVRSKGRSGVLAFFFIAAPAIPLMLATSYALGDNMAAKGFAMWLAAFLCPAVGLVWALVTPNQSAMAVKDGAYGDMRKCPFCAEAVRREAIKCKHCGSALEPVPFVTPTPSAPSSWSEPSKEAPNVRSWTEPPFGG